MAATRIISTTDTATASTTTRIDNPKMLLAMRVIWVLLIVFALSVFVLSVPIQYDNIRNSQRFGLGFRDVLSEMNISLNFFAAYLIFFDILLTVATGFLALILFWRRSDDWMALVVGLTIFYSAVAVSQTTYQFSILLGSLVTTIGLPLLFTFLYIFPNGRFVPRYSPILIIISIPITLAAIPSLALVQRGGGNPEILYTTVRTLLLVYPPGVVAQIYRYYYVSTPLQRQQTKWLVLGLSISLLVIVLFFAIPAIFPELAHPGIFPEMGRYTHASLIWLFISVPGVLLSQFLVPLAIMISIVRYRLYDIDIVINRSLVYGSVGLLVLALFFGAVVGLQIVIGQTQPLIALILAGLILAAIFRPVTRRVQNLVDRHIYGLRFDLNELHAWHRHTPVSNPGILSGKVLSGYEVLGLVGQGGMGEVYQGSGNGRTVAIKTMLPKIAQDAGMRSRFQREAQAGMQLDHPHIAKVYTYSEIDGTPYLVMDFIEGQDLSRLLKSDGKLDEETTTRMMNDICGALDVAHNQGFVHRDLKPSNIMIRPNGQAILMDFGVTKMTDASTSLTGTGAIGTIDYMAPEQIMSAREVDHRADIYALGVMLYELVTGQKPFSGGPAQVMFAHIQQPVPDPCDINDEIPQPIANAIMRAMSKTPEDRYQSAGAFAAALQTAEQV